MDNSERGMNPVALTFINPRKEYWLSRRSNQRLPVLKSWTLSTELWGYASHTLPLDNILGSTKLKIFIERLGKYRKDDFFLTLLG